MWVTKWKKSLRVPCGISISWSGRFKARNLLAHQPLPWRLNIWEAQGLTSSHWEDAQGAQCWGAKKMFEKGFRTCYRKRTRINRHESRETPPPTRGNISKAPSCSRVNLANFRQSLVQGLKWCHQDLIFWDSWFQSSLFWDNLSLPIKWLQLLQTPKTSASHPVENSFSSRLWLSLIWLCIYPRTHPCE